MTYQEEANKTVDNIRYDSTTLSSEGKKIEVRKVWMPITQANSIVYEQLPKPFTFDNFTSPRLPIDLGPFDINCVYGMPRILRATIKPIGENILYLPKELSPLQKMIQQVVEYDRLINPNFTQNEVHITLDHGVVKPGETQRFPGWHVDGLQGGKFKTKLPAEHSYVIATNNPTEFCLQPFFIKQYNEDHTNFFKTFDQQAQDCNIYRGLPNHLYLMDAYMVHRTPLIREESERAFIRITIANAPLPIEHNTLNPMLNAEKPPFKLDIRDWLREPDQPINYDYYGLEDKPEVKDKLSDSEIQRLRDSAKQDIGVFENAPLHEGKRLKITQKNFPKVQPNSPLYKDMLEVFDPLKYTNPRLPIDLGTANVEQIQKCPNVLRMLLKWENNNEVLIPQELLPIKPLLTRIFSYDKTHNPDFTKDVAHITIDTREVKAGLTHRFPGFHGDDLQGGAFPVKDKIAHSYILTTSPATEFCLQPFFVAHIDDSHEKHFTEFDKQALEENIYTVKPNHIYLMDPYAVHRTPQEVGEGLRTFLRVTFSTKQMLLPHNTINPMFDEVQKEYDNLKFPHLFETFFTQRSDKKIPWSYYGLSEKS